MKDYEKEDYNKRTKAGSDPDPDPELLIRIRADPDPIPQHRFFHTTVDLNLTM